VGFFGSALVITRVEIIVVIAVYIHFTVGGEATGAVEDVVAGDGIWVGVTAEDIEGTVGLEAGVVKDVFASAAKFIALARFDHGATLRVFMCATTGAKDVAKDVEWAFGGASGGNVLEGAFDVVAPNANVHVCAFAFDGVVPYACDEVAVDVGVAIGAAFKAVVGTATNGVVEAVVVRGDNFIVPNDVVAR